MKDKVLAFVENNIAMRLLLASRLDALGFHVTVVSSPRAFRSSLASRPIDWLILDEAALAGDQDLLAGVTQHRNDARIVWLGRPPRQRRLPIEAVFATPLRYDEVTRFFSRWAPRHAHRPGGPSRADGPPRDPGTGLGRHCLPGREGMRKASAGAVLCMEAVGGDTR